MPGCARTRCFYRRHRRRPDERPDGWWTLDETSGTVAADSSGTGHNGTIGSAVTLGAPGVHGTAFVFDGSGGSYVQMPDPVAPPTTQISVAAWIRPDSFNCGQCAIVSNEGLPGDNTYGYGLRVIDGGSRLQFCWGTEGGPGNCVYGNYQFPTGSWIHVAGTYNGNVLREYVNGTLVAETPGVFPALNTSRLLTIGRLPSTNLPWEGAIDDVRVYSRVLSDSELAGLASSTLGWWTLDETSGTVAADSSGNGYNGAIGSAVTLGAPGVHGTAFVFDGSGGSYVQMPDPVAPPTTQISVAAWIRADSFNCGQCAIVSNEGFPGDNTWGYGLRVINGGSTLQFCWGTQDGNQNPPSGCVYSNYAFPIGTWTHVAATYDGSVLREYVNGTLIGETPAAFPALNTFRPLTVGRLPSTQLPWEGAIDDVRVYDRVLSATELTTLGTPPPAAIALTPVASVASKVYDGTTAATVNGITLTGVIGTDAVQATWATATFVDANAGAAKTVTITGLALTGADAAKYALSATTTSATADITPAPLTITADDKSMQQGDPLPTLTASYMGFVKGETSASALVGVPSVTTTATSASPAGSYPIHVSAGGPCTSVEGLASWWSADGTAADRCGSNPATLLGAAYTTGVSGQAFQFNGAGASVRVPFNANLISPQFSAAAWVEPQATIGGQAVIVGQGHGAYQLLVRPGTTGVLPLWQIGTADGAFYTVGASHEIPLNMFTHVAGTWDGTTLRLYLNGVLDAELVPNAVPGLNSTCPIDIGGFAAVADSAGCYGFDAQQFFAGAIDEVSIYGEALSAAQIQQAMSTPPAGGLTSPNYSLHFVDGALTVLNPAPVITMISSLIFTQNGGGTILVNGSGFVPQSVVELNGTTITSSYVSSTSMTATIPANLVATFITVFNASPGGGTSDPQPIVLPPITIAPVLNESITASSGGAAIVTTGGTGAGTPGSLTATFDGSGTVAVAQYGGNPSAAPPLGATNSYFDILVVLQNQQSLDTRLKALNVLACNLNGGTSVTWFNGTAWVDVLPQSFTIGDGCAPLTFNNQSTPTLAQLTGSYFAAVDRIPPSVSIAATPNQLWPPNGKLVTVVVSGRASDIGSGLASASYAVTDEYGEVRPSGTLTVDASGAYSFTVGLPARRDGGDKDGRTFTVVVRAVDKVGNVGTATTRVVVPHDQR